MTTLIDRSRILAYQACPRQRYLQYHHQGTGLQSARLSVPLTTGTFIHLGLETMLKTGSVEAAVERAVGGYNEAAAAALGAMLVHEDHYAYTVAEQRALTEALVRVWAIKTYPTLVETYEVIEVESEYEYELAPGITFMAKLDGLLRRRSDSEYEVLSFKTDTGKGLDSKVADARLDAQGLTEPEAVIQVTDRWRKQLDTDALTDPPEGPIPNWYKSEYMQSGNAIIPFAVLMQWLVKGEWKEEIKGSGRRYQESHLVRPWRRLGVTGVEWAWSYYYPCPGTEHKIEGKNGRLWTCKGTEGKHALGDSWERVPIWEHMTVAEWIELLLSGSIQPGAGDPLEGVIYVPPPIFRNAEDQRRRMVQITAQEMDVAHRLEGVRDAASAALPETLDWLFPQHTNTCNHSFGGPCQFRDGICFAAEPAEALREPDGFKPRVPHHVGELIQIGG